MRNHKGFTLIEVLAAVVVFTMMATVAVPLLVRVYKEQLSIHEERQVLQVLHNHMQEWLSKGTISHDTITLHTRKYPIHWRIDDQTKTASVCVIWKASNGRNNKKCAYGKMKKD